MDEKILNIIIIILAFLFLLIIVFSFKEKQVEFKINDSFKTLLPVTADLPEPMPLIKNFYDYFQTGKEISPDKNIIQLTSDEKKVFIELEESVSGIIKKGSGNVAIINKNIFSEGDLYQDKLIEEILEDRIIMSKGINYYVMYFK